MAEVAPRICVACDPFTFPYSSGTSEHLYAGTCKLRINYGVETPPVPLEDLAWREVYFGEAVVAVLCPRCRAYVHPGTKKGHADWHREVEKPHMCEQRF